MKRTLESNLGHTVFVPKNTVTVWLSRSVLPSLPQVHPNQEHTDSRNITKLSQGTSEIVHSLCGAHQNPAGLCIFTNDVHTHTTQHSSGLVMNKCWSDQSPPSAPAHIVSHCKLKHMLSTPQLSSSYLLLRESWQTSLMAPFLAAD